MSRRTYEPEIDGEPETHLLGESYFESCCDCGLVHRVLLGVIESEDGYIRKVLLRRWRDTRRTAQTRRWMRKKQEGVFSGPSRAGRGKIPKRS